ncbi:MAG: outer membrane protein assembly factor BamA [Thermoanaerobaculia bacterium]
MVFHSARTTQRRAKAARRIALALLALAVGSGPLASVLSDSIGRADATGLVSRVEIRSDAPLGRVQDVEELVEIGVGDVFDPAAVARSLRALQASGLAGEIEAFTLPSPDGGLDVAFALWKRVQVQDVRIEGESGIKEAELRAVLEVRAAQPLYETQVVRGVYRLQELFEERGYLQARVRVGVDVDEELKLAEVVYHVDSGAPFVVGTVSFDGEISPFGEEELHQRLRAGPEERYDQATVRADAERLEQWLIQQDHRLALVDRASEEIDWENQRVNLAYPISLGPRFEIEVTGTDLKVLHKKDLIPFLGRERYDEVMLIQSAARIRSFYQQRGHYRVEVDWQEQRSVETLDLSLTVEPGPVYRLDSVELVGNEAISGTELAPLVLSSPRRLFVQGSGRLVDQVLDDDIENIRSYYLLKGFFDVAVGPAEIDSRDDRLSVTIPIAEGPQRRVVSLTFDGVENLDPEELGEGLPLRPGGPFHPRLLDESLDTIRSRYGERGFEAVQLATVQEWDPEQILVDIGIQVLEGPKGVVDRVIIRGNQRTRTSVVQRAIGLKPGSTLSTGRLLEAQRRLYDLGVFSRVDVRRSAGTPFSGARDVQVRVEEGKNRSVNYGVGFDSEAGLRGLLGFSHSNLLGRALGGRIDLRYSQREQLFRALIRQSYIGRAHIPTTYSLFYIAEERESFTSRRQGGQVLLQRYTNRQRHAVRYNYRIVDTLDVDPALEPIEIDRELSEVRISSITPSNTWDHRNDPIDPTTGWSTTVQLEYAFPLFAADASFLKAFTQQTGYFSLGPFGVLAASFRLGGIEPVGSTTVDDPTVPEGLPSRYIPISERFFAGGRTTHRAYKRDTLGVPGETLLVVPNPDDPDAEPRLVPIGGNALVIANLEYRFPIFGTFGGTAFFDAGNVWADWRNIDLGDSRPGIGVGARWLSPVGPLRVEIGWKLDKLPQEDPYVIFFSFGNAF